MENSDYSDSSDEDYIPNEGEVVSEEDESGDDEDVIADEDDNSTAKEKTLSSSSAVNLKRQQKKAKDAMSKKKRKGWHHLESIEGGAKEKREIVDSSFDELQERENSEKEAVKNKKLEEKEKADLLWADFMKGTETTKLKPKTSSGSEIVKLKDDIAVSSSTSSSSSSSSSSSTSSQSSVSKASCLPSSLSSAANKSTKVTVVKEYDFAGETVTVTKELDVNSKEAKLALSSASSSKSEPTTSSSSSSATLKRPAGGGVGGLNAVLGKLNKKPKISTLDKSKLDWDGFKHKEGIEDELKIHNRGKDGYLERVAFLQRTDERQYEIERTLRLGFPNKP